MNCSISATTSGWRSITSTWSNQEMLESEFKKVFYRFTHLFTFSLRHVILEHCSKHRRPCWEHELMAVEGPVSIFHLDVTELLEEENTFVMFIKFYFSPCVEMRSPDPHWAACVCYALASRLWGSPITECELLITFGDGIIILPRDTWSQKGFSPHLNLRSVDDERNKWLLF